jgi:hypothetical protein
VFPFIAMTEQHLSPRVLELKQALSNSIGLLHTLVQQVEKKLGPGSLGEELNQFANSGPAVRAFMSRIDQLISEGQQPVAAREFREFAGGTWDQAHDAIAKWTDCAINEKIRSLQLALWVKSQNRGEQT